MPELNPIRVLVVDDSFTAQLNLRRLLEADPNFQVVGTASTGEEAMNEVRRLTPDVVTMDIQMAQMDGIEATRAIMSSTPVPILIVSTYGSHPEWSVKALAAGALSIMEKPPGPGAPEWERSGEELRSCVRQLSGVRVVRRWGLRAQNEGEPASTVNSAYGGRKFRVVAIGASTGGPAALQQLLSPLPANFRAPILIVQHIAGGFGPGLARWLGDEIKLPVSIAQTGERPLPGHVYLAPDHRHLELAADGTLNTTAAPPESGLRPAVSVLFRSVAKHAGPDAIGILLTGMGRDGAEELALMQNKGALTIAQDKDSSVVHGMPGEAIRLKAASMILSPPQMAQTLIRLILS